MPIRTEVLVRSNALIYAAFTFWLLLILFAGIGVYRQWARLVKPSRVSWALLPGTVISEMAYIFGCLITGGEIRRAKLIPPRDGKGGEAESEPTAEAAAGLKFVGPIVAALLAIVACGAAIVAVHALLGEPVIRQFRVGTHGLLPVAALPKELPTSWDGLWGQVEGQVSLLRRMCETWGGAKWTNWRVPLFVYLSLCLSVRLSPVRRPVRPTLGAVVAIAAAIALVGLIWRRFDGLMEDIWPLLTYVWASLLFMLVITLLLRGIAALVRILAGKESA